MEAMVENCVLLAKMLRRALVAPRPIVDLGNSTWASPANPQLEPLSFGSLWDAKHFKRCARQHGVDVLDEAAQSPNARIGSSVQQRSHHVEVTHSGRLPYGSPVV